MKKENITIEDLAIMTQKGFSETNKKMDTGFHTVELRFDKVEKRLDRIEKILIAQHQRRIEKLEDEVKELKELLAVA